jgi:hypothetical protein
VFGCLERAFDVGGREDDSRFGNKRARRFDIYDSDRVMKAILDAGLE